LADWQQEGELEEDQGKDGLRTLKKIYRGWEYEERREWKTITEKAKTHRGL
jgi:hypothetical protein